MSQWRGVQGLSLARRRALRIGESVRSAWCELCTLSPVNVLSRRVQVKGPTHMTGRNDTVNEISTLAGHGRVVSEANDPSSLRARSEPRAPREQDDSLLMH